MHGYLDLTAEEVAAVAAAIGVDPPWHLMAADLPADAIADLARLGRRHLLARDLVTHDDAGYHIDSGLAAAVAVMGDPFVVTIVVEVGRETRSGSWVFVGEAAATIVTSLGDGVVRIRSIGIDAVPTAIARVAGLDRDLAPADDTGWRIDIQAIAAAAEELARDPDSSPFARADHAGLAGLDEAAEAIGDEGRVHAVVTIHPTSDGEPEASSTLWLEADGTLAALDLDEDRRWLSAVPVTSTEVLERIRGGFPRVAA